MSENKRFEDWETVDCNECGRYWDSSCDGANSDKRPCNSFLPTRSVVIPAQIKRLETRINSLTILIGGLFGGFIVHVILHVLGAL